MRATIILDYRLRLLSHPALLRVVGILFAIFCCSDLVFAQPAKPTETALDHLSSIRIPVTEVPQQKLRAMSGSSASAIRLANHFAMVFGDLREAILWTEIAVENGDQEAQCSLADRLVADDTGPLNLVRARFWYNKLSQSGSVRLQKCARAGLGNLKIVEEYRRTHSAPE